MDEKKKIIWKKRTINAKRKRYLTPEQQADLFARTNLVDDEDFMFSMWYYWCDPHALGKAYNMPVQQAVLRMCDINFGIKEDRHGENMVKLREKMLTAYKLSDYIKIYNIK